MEFYKLQCASYADYDDQISTENCVLKKTGCDELDIAIDEWFKWDRNPETRCALEKYIKMKLTQGKIDELRNTLVKRMEFGTAGLRGVMAPGPGNMNDLVIIQTTQGFLRYIESCPSSRRNSVVIGYDGRYNSKRFAELAALAFINGGFEVYLFSNLCPTPFVPFAVTLFKCRAGIMVTASHNPKEDNGYKVYWENGAQIIPPHDKHIQEYILDNLEPWKDAWKISRLRTSEKLVDPLPKVMEEYYKNLIPHSSQMGLREKSHLKFTYTPMHGVGQTYMEKAFEVAKLKPFISVREQMNPDPDFPTVKFPNPEEGKSALDLAIKTADSNKSTIIIANDPDSDRLAVAEKLKSGEWKVFNGNEIGVLLGWWNFHCFVRDFGHHKLPTCYMIASTVSSKFLKTMAKIEGFNFIETLTGFKWMGNKACELMKNGSVVLFAYEEAIGFMNGTVVLDKDGISAAVRLAEAAVYLESAGVSLNEKLQNLYFKYGYHISDNSYYICHDPIIIAKIFDRIRNYHPENLDNKYPSKLIDGQYKVASIRDLTTGYDSEQPDKRAILPVSKSSQMITINFTNGLVVTLRTSGTEPKIKYYTEICGQPEEKDPAQLASKLRIMVKEIVRELLQPKIHGLPLQERD